MNISSVSRKLRWSIAVVVVGALSIGLPSAAPAAKKKHPASGCQLVTTTKESTCVGTAIEAWYHPETSLLPTPVPTPVVGPPAVNPYDDQTLHTGVKMGQEDSRMYFTLDVVALGLTAIPQSGTLVIPVDPAASSDVKTAALHLCYVSSPPEKSVEGSTDTPPKVDCSIDADPKYHKKPRPYLSFDLTPFASVLTSGGLALVPTQKASDAQQTWHVETYAKKNTDKDAMTIAAVVKVQKVSEPGLNDIIGGGSGLSSSGPALGSGGSAPLTGSGSGGLSIGNSGSGSSQPLAGGQQSPGPTQAQTQPSPGAIALAPVAAVRYPGIWFVPLVIVVGAGFFGFALTRDVIIRRS